MSTEELSDPQQMLEVTGVIRDALYDAFEEPPIEYRRLTKDRFDGCQDTLKIDLGHGVVDVYIRYTEKGAQS